LPRDYERSETQGFGLRDVGYYLPLSENIDLKFLSDIFNGTYGLGVVSNYDKRYKYRGVLNFVFITPFRAAGYYEKLSSKSLK
jgi:hypothetical protein